MRRKDGGSVDEKLVESLARMDEGTRDRILRGFFTDNRMVARQLVSYWKESGIDASNSDLVRLQEMVRDEIDREIKRKRELEIEQLVTEASRFREDAFKDLYLMAADFEEKRRAYDDGDRYLEDFSEQFTEDHDGLIIFKDLAARAEREWRSGNKATAILVYKDLIAVYDEDTGVRKLFIDDDDFPEVDLGMAFGDIDTIRKRAGGKGARKARKALREPVV